MVTSSSTSTKAFRGLNVFMSRNLVPPEVFDSVHDALKLSGADVFLCCDPSRNGPNDYHIISSSHHDKFEDLRAKGCNLLGPQCVLTCAKERRPLPKQGFTCCLAMDGVKVLASGFDKDEKGKLEKLVTAMGGVLHTKASLDISFVIVKNVRAAKYKWAVHVKKPVVTINWLYQCWNEHRVVPQESYRVPAFSGLIICVTRIPADERKEMEKVARKWGTIQIVSQKWYDQSIARRVCLNEEAYTVSGKCASSFNIAKSRLTVKHSQEKNIGGSQSVTSSVVPDSNFRATPSQTGDSDLEATLSQNFSYAISDAPVFVERETGGASPSPPKTDAGLDNCVADDSQTEDDDLYLSDCRICLVGFDASDMRKLVNMVHRGGGSRYVSYSESLTHVVVGAPSDAEKKDLRVLAALGVIHVVRPIWLEDCDREKREIPVIQKHTAYDILLPKDLIGSSNKGPTVGLASMKQGKSSTVSSGLSMEMSQDALGYVMGMQFEKSRGQKVGADMNDHCSVEGSVRSSQQSLLSAANDKRMSQQKIQHGGTAQSVRNEKSYSVFIGKIFCFSDSFPEDRREEVVQWINQGGGEVVDDQLKENVDFIIECHGIKPLSSGAAQTTYVSSHWIYSCLEDGCLLNVGGHILYSPLPCQIPLLGFESFKFCVSQYEEKDRLLLRNLCFVLGAKFVEKLTKKVTHLLCKFTSGPKYEAACKWGIRPITCEWIYECVKKNEVVPLDPFYPKEVSAEDQEAGLCTVTQYPTQAVCLVSGDNSLQLSSQFQDLRKPSIPYALDRTNSDGEGMEDLTCSNKRARLLEKNSQIDALAPCPGLSKNIPTRNNPMDENIKDNGRGYSSSAPDVAAAIEDLLEQTSKIHDLKSPGEIECGKTIFSSDCPVLGTNHPDSHSAFGLSNHWLSRVEKKDEPAKPSAAQSASVLDGFSETQTDSQLVGYEEDLSGRQMIIDRVRTRSSMI
ncbi:hypothetical protein Ancab_037439 [Ancistrocladus abbreviatus]